MSSYVVAVPAGTQSLVQSVTPTTNIAVGPALLGGSVLLETAPTPQGPWSQPLGTLTAGGSTRLSTSGYARVTATTQAATMVLSEMSGANSPLANGTLISANAIFASPSSAAAQTLFSFRIPPNFLPLNFRLEISFSLDLTNSANVKTVNVLMNGAGGTNFGAAAVTSFATWNGIAVLSGSDGANLKGYIGAVLAGGMGGSTTALPTLARDYVNLETEIVISITKATAAETAQVDSVAVVLFT